MEAINKDQAAKEVHEWLDRMDIPQANRERGAVKASIDVLTEAVMKGEMIFNSDETITQVLQNPLGDGATKELIYEFTYDIGAYDKATKGTSLGNGEDIAYCLSRLSLISKAKHPIGVFQKLKKHDWHVAKQLTVFF